MALPSDRQRQLELEAEAEFELENEQVQGAMSRSAPQLETGGEALTGGALSVLNGLLLNQGDEVVGTGAGTIDYLSDAFTGENPDKPYTEYLKERMQQSEDLRKGFNQEDPVAGLFTEVGGSLINPLNLMGKAKGLSAAQKTLRAAGTGALQGGIYGAGEDTSDQKGGGTRLENAVEGGAWGGALGGGLQALIGGASNLFKDVGGRLRRGAIGLNQADVRKAANTVAKGAPNPLIEGFENLADEGVFKGSKAPAAIQQRLSERAGKINEDLSGILSTANEKGERLLPEFKSSEKYIKRLKGSDFKEAQEIFQKEVTDLVDTLDNGGTIDDWQAAKKSIQGNTKYGSSSASLQNDVRTQIASDLRQHIENQADALIPEKAGDVKALNKKLSEGLRVDEVLERGKNKDLAADPWEQTKQVIRTSGGYGVPMLLAGGGEYKRSGDINQAIAVGALGAIAGSRRGKYAIGSALKGIGAITGGALPTIMTKAGVPLIVKQVAGEGITGPPVTPLDHFKAGEAGVAKFKQDAGNSQENLDTLYSSVTSNFKDFAAPNGTVDEAKAKKWIENNKEALSVLPNLKQQLSNPSAAQELINQRFQGVPPLAKGEIELNALKEYTQADPGAFLGGILQSDNPKADLSKALVYLKQDKDAANGLRRAAVTLFDSNPSVYAGMKDLAKSSGLLTESQIKIADFFYGNTDKAQDTSTLKAITDIARGGFLSSAPYGKYIQQLEPLLKSMPPEEVQERLKNSFYDPLVARDLLNKANAKNITRSVTALFGDKIAEATGGMEASAAAPAEPRKISKPVLFKQETATSSEAFPSPKKLLKSPRNDADLNSTRLNLGRFLQTQGPETRARISTESSGDPWAISPKGAQGLSQLMPGTAEEIAGELGETYMPLRRGMSPEEQQASIKQNVRFGDYYYEKMLKRFDHPYLARAAYNAGPGRVQEAQRLAGTSRDVNKILSNLPKGVQKETLPYVRKIAARYGS